jgi:hypothetical protein
MTDQERYWRVWDAIVLSLLHPTQLLIIEALGRIGLPMSPTVVVRVIDGEITLNLVDYHCKRLVELGILEKKSRRPVRGVWENFYGFHEEVG